MSAHEGECSFLFQPLDDNGNPNDRDHCRICGKPRTVSPVPVTQAAMSEVIGTLRWLSLAGADYSKASPGLMEVRERAGAALGLLTGELEANHA